MNRKGLAFVFTLVAPLGAQVSWQEIGTESLDRIAAPIAYDSIDGLAWSFGGGAQHEVASDRTRFFAGDRWFDQPTATLPPARRDHGMVFDSVRNRLVMFGGRQSDGSSIGMGDTWEFDGVDWTLVATSGPAPRYDFAMAFDDARGVTVLYGGAPESGLVEFSDTWEWDGVSWTPGVIGGTVPGERFGARAVYDAMQGDVVLYGGGNYVSHPWGGIIAVPGEVWRYDGFAWTQSAGPASTGRTGHALAYDPASGDVHVIGGEGGLWSEHWVLSQGGTWSALPAPLDRIGQAHAAWSGPAVGIVVTSGLYGAPHTVRWSGGTWFDPPSSWPRARSLHAMTADTARDRLVLFGGWNLYSEFGDTWEWNGTGWTERAVGAGPGVRRFHTLTFHSATGQSVLYGGSVGTTSVSIVGDTRLWDGTAWTTPAPAIEPPPLTRHGVSDDPSRGKLLLFGGVRPVGTSGAGVFTDETWEWDGSTWQQQNPATVPTARTGHAMAFDPSRGAVVMFGGSLGTGGVGSDTWAYDGNDWTQLSVAPPSQMVAPRLAWDPYRERLVLQGYESAIPSPGMIATWELIGSVWTRRSTDPILGLGPMAYDSNLGRVVSFGSHLQPDTVMWSWGSDFLARADAFGSGCAGSHGLVLETTPTQLPWIGETVEVSLDNLAPGASPFLAFGFSDQVWGGSPLPLDLTPFGAPGCSIWSSVDVVEPLTGTPAVWQLALPLDPMLLGYQVFGQGLAIDPANPLSLVTGNALELTVGAR